MTLAHSFGLYDKVLSLLRKVIPQAGWAPRYFLVSADLDSSVEPQFPPHAIILFQGLRYDTGRTTGRTSSPLRHPLPRKPHACVSTTH